MATKKKGEQKPSLIARRGFLTWLGGLGTGALASYFANQLPSIESPIPKAGGKITAVKSILVPSETLKFQYGASHYLIEGTHSDNANAGGALVRAISTIVKTEPSNDPSLFELDQPSDWVLVGAPSSNKLTCRILGYDVNNIIKKPLDEHNLRFLYEYEDELVNLKRYTASGQLQAQAKRAYIKDLATGNFYRPDEGGWLEEDFLLITRLPMIGSNGARTIVGGTHGVGTRGVELLLESDPFSSRQKRLLAEGIGKGFQILAKVESKTVKSKTMPTDIVVIDVHIA